MSIFKQRGLVGTLCGACIVTLVALGFGAAPARAQTTPTCVVLSFPDGNPVQQGSNNGIAHLDATVFVQTTPASSCGPPLQVVSQQDAGSGSALVLFGSVDSHNVQTSCENGVSFNELFPPFLSTGEPVLYPSPPPHFELSDLAVGTYGLSVHFSPGTFPTVDRSFSPCVDYVVTPCTGPVSIAADLASGPGMPFAGTTDQWTVLLLPMHSSDTHISRRP